jgi:hypothetical protein
MISQRDNLRQRLIASRCVLASLCGGRRLIAILMVAILACSVAGSLRPALDPIEHKTEKLAFEPFRKARLLHASVTFNILYAPTRQAMARSSRRMGCTTLCLAGRPVERSSVQPTG